MAIIILHISFFKQPAAAPFCYEFSQSSFHAPISVDHNKTAARPVETLGQTAPAPPNKVPTYSMPGAFFTAL